MNFMQRAIERLTLYKVQVFGSGSSEPDMSDREETTDLGEAGVISSLRKKRVGTARRHDVVLDIDLPVHVEESTNGNNHLYVETPFGISEENYFRLLDVLADCGVIEPGYAEASKARGYTGVRLPWVVKR